MESSIKQNLLTLIQSYAVAYKSEDKLIISLVTNEITKYLDQVDLVQKSANVEAK